LGSRLSHRLIHGMVAHAASAASVPSFVALYALTIT
jgi:hypothetical protein